MDLYHNILENYQQEPPTLHFFSVDRRIWQYMEFLFCELTRTCEAEKEIKKVINKQCPQCETYTAALYIEVNNCSGEKKVTDAELYYLVLVSPNWWANASPAF